MNLETRQHQCWSWGTYLYQSLNLIQGALVFYLRRIPENYSSAAHGTNSRTISNPIWQKASDGEFKKILSRLHRITNPTQQEPAYFSTHASYGYGVRLVEPKISLAQDGRVSGVQTCLVTFINVVKDLLLYCQAHHPD